MVSKKGFTLAEILITLGIIGIVSAMTIPSLYNKVNERITVSRLRKTYSSFAQGLKMAENELGNMDSWYSDDDTSDVKAKIIADNLKKYIKFSEECGIDDKHRNCVVAIAYKELNGNPRTNYSRNSEELTTYKIKLSDGSSVWFGFVKTAKRIHIYVDTNGTKLPNTWGRDLFLLEYHDGELFPAGTSGKNTGSYTKECSGYTSTGVGCAYYVLRYGNMNYLH